MGAHDNRFLTPETLQGDDVQITLSVRSHLVSFLRGALSELEYEENWQEFGASGTDETAAYFREVVSGIGEMGESMSQPKLVHSARVPTSYNTFDLTWNGYLSQSGFMADYWFDSDYLKDDFVINGGVVGYTIQKAGFYLVTIGFVAASMSDVSAQIGVDIDGQSVVRVDMPRNQFGSTWYHLNYPAVLDNGQTLAYHLTTHTKSLRLQDITKYRIYYVG